MRFPKFEVKILTALPQATCLLKISLLNSCLSTLLLYKEGLSTANIGNVHGQTKR